MEFFHIADAEGNVVYGVNQQEKLNIEQREFFQEAKKHPTSSLVVSKPLKGLRSGKWGIYLARRMNNPDGSFAGVCYAAIRLESLRNVISSVVTGPGGSIVLRNTDMTFLTRFPELPGSDADVGTLGNISKQLRSAMASGAEFGTITLFSPADNTWRISSFARITSYPFIVIAGYSRDEILKPWRFELYGIAVGLLLLTLITGFFTRQFLKNSIEVIQYQSEKRFRVRLEELNAKIQSDLDAAIIDIRQKDQTLISQSRQAAMGEMINNIAHQWRQPLNALALLFSNLELSYKDRTLNDESFDKAVDTADMFIQKMSTTIDDFRDFFSQDKIKVPFMPLKKITRTIELVEASYKTSGIRIMVEPGEECIMFGFPNEFSQVLLNLFGNAREAIVASGVEGGLITITYGKRGEMGFVTVQDNGGGIPVDIIDRVFEPYFTTKEMGTGIGLYMSKMIIERNMNGRIEVQNAQSGCIFSLSVPLKDNNSAV